MKRKTFAKLSTSLVLATGILAAEVGANAGTWSGASTDSQFWSDTNNWDNFLAPTDGVPVNFANAGSTNELGVVNNIVASDTTILNINYQAPVSFLSPLTNYHTTLIAPGATLKLDRAANSGALIAVGQVKDPADLDYQYFYTVTGLGASLEAGSVSAPMTNQGVQVTATQRLSPNHVGSLDLSGLDNFAFGGGYFWVGINGGEGTPTTDRPVGKVYLAKTNLIVIAGTYYDSLNLGSFRVGESRANTPSQPSFLELGQDNTFCTPWLKIGGSRATGLMYFRPGLDNPTLKLRGTDGTNRLGTVRIADNSYSTSASSIGASGVVDLSGGTVDALVDTLYVGQGPGGNDTTATGKTAGAKGTLTWTAGTFDVNTLLLGYQYGNNLSTNTGTLNVQGPEAKLIAGRLVVGRDAGANAGGGVGFLNIDGGTVEILTYLAENLGGPNVTSALTVTNNGILNLQPAGSAVPATATFTKLNFSSGTLTNGTLAMRRVDLFSPATAFPVYPTTVINPGPVGTVATLTINGNLALQGGRLSFDVTDTVTMDTINVVGDLNVTGANFVQVNPLNAANPITAGTYPLVTYGSLSGAGSFQTAGNIADSRYVVSFDTTAPNVNMNIAGSAGSLWWSGGNNGDVWDVKNTLNWNSGTEQFYTYDTVNFDDTSASAKVALVGTVVPLGVNLYSSKDYTFAGAGKISGGASLTQNGPGVLTILTTNDYTGGTVINGGTLTLGDDVTAGSVNGNIVNYGTLVFNRAGTQTSGNVISGTGNVIKRGTGVTKLSGANTFKGDVTVEAGILQPGVATAFGDATVSGGMVTVQDGATLDIAGIALGTKPVTITGAGVGGAGALVNSGGAQFMRDVQLAGDTVIGGSSGITISSSSASSTDPGLTVYEHKLTKVSGSHLKISCLRATPWNLLLGEVDIQGGAISFYDNLILGNLPLTPVTVRSNATVAFANNVAFPLTKAFVLDDGSCVMGLGADSTVDGSMTINGRVAFDLANAMALTVNCPIDGTGSLVKGVGIHPAIPVTSGTANLVLAAANTFTGDLRVETGKVLLTGSGSVDQAANIILAGGTLDVTGRTDATLTLKGSQSLQGDGGITGIFISPSGTRVSPGGASVGTLSVAGAATLGGTTTMRMSKTGATLSNDKLNVTGALTLGGVLNVTYSGDALAVGDKFALFTGTIDGAFAPVTLPEITGVVWTNKTALDGTIEVLSVPVATPPTIGGYQVSTDGTFKLQFSGEAGTGYSVLGSTNAAAPLNIWTVLQTGVFGTDPLEFIDTDATNYALRFYRVSTP